MSPSDEELLAAMRSGDRAALATLYDRHAPWLTLRLARRLAWLVERASEAAAAPGRPVHDAVLPIADVDVYGGFVVSLDDARLALELLRRDSTDVAARLAEHWDVVSRPTTTTAELARLAGVPVPVGGGPRAPFVAHMDPDLVRLGAPCR